MEKNIILECVAKSCPEIHNAYDTDNNLVGQIKFMFGQMEVHPTDENGNVLHEICLFSKIVNDDYLGVIPDKLRETWLNESIEKLIQYYEKN